LEDAYISIARITKTQGLKGEVRIEQLLEDDAVFGSGRRVILSGAGTAERETEIDFFRRQHGHCVVKFHGIEGISEAERYVGAEIKIPAGDLPALKEGSYYTFDLKGCQVFAADGGYLGIVTDVLGSGGAEILKVDRDEEETLIPFAESYLKSIDLERRRIEVDLPEELRDLNK
jgi:16S rRNA processing protein RimM